MKSDAVTTPAPNPYVGCSIVNIHTHDRFPGVIYAEVVSASGEILISATLDYCAQKVKERFPRGN
jgi:hypothetical protein